MKKIALVLLFLGLVTTNDGIYKEFENFVKKYDKKYSSIEEYMARYNVFSHNLKKSLKEEHKTYKTEINQFSDLTKQEFAKMLNLEFDALSAFGGESQSVTNLEKAPDAFDWRDYGRVPPVRNQGSCGGAWVFSTYSCLESLYYASKQQMKIFSIQQVIDCDSYDHGCNGGLISNLFKWLKENGGVNEEKDYPYKGKQSVCQQDSSKYVDMKVTDYKRMSFEDEEEMKEFLYAYGPLIVGLNATPLQTYGSGIIDLTETQCPSSGINHLALLVGYGTEAGVDYWIVQNTWGAEWGESGYFRVSRGKGTCGINKYVIFPIVEF